MLWQTPNFPLYSWIIITVASHLVAGDQLKTSLQNLAAAFLFVWAYLEVTRGDSPFRKILGGIVLAILAYNFLIK